MYVLDSATKILTITASAACDVTVSGFRDAVNPPSFSYQTKIGAGETKTVCPAGSAAAPRCIDNISITNTGAANTISVKQDDTGSPDVATILSSMVLAASEKGQYTHASGWDTIDANAAKKSTQSGVAVASGKTLTVSNTLTLAGTDGTTVTFPSTSATVARTDAGQTFTGTNTFGALTLTGNVGVTGTPSFTLTGCALTAGAGSFTTLSASGNTTLGVSGASTSIAIIGNNAVNDGPLIGLSKQGGSSVQIGYFGAASAIRGGGSTSNTLRFTGTAASPIVEFHGSDANATATLQVGVTGITVTGTADITGTTVNMTTSGTTLTVGVGADNGTVSAGVFTDRTKAFEGDALAAIKGIKAKGGHIDHASLPAFATANVRKQSTDAKGKVTETIEVERDLGAMISMLTVAVQELDARKMDKP